MTESAPRAIAVDAGGALWVADAAGRLFAIDADGGARLVADGLDDARALDTGDGAVWVACAGAWARVEAATGEVVRFGAGDVDPVGLAIDAEAEILWVADAAAGRVLATRVPPLMLAGAPVELPGARGLALAPDRRRVYVACAAGVAAIQTGDRRVVSVMDATACTDLDDARAITVTPPGLAVAGGRRGLIGVNHRHGTATAVWREGAGVARDVAFDRRDKSYVIADERAGLIRVARDGSRADAIAVDFAAG